MLFEKVEVAHRDFIESIRKRYNHSTSSHAFTSIFLWKYSMKLTVYFGSDIFCVKRENLGSNHYFFPCGNDGEKKRIISELLEKEQIGRAHV